MVSILTPACFANAPTVIEQFVAFMFLGYTLDFGLGSRPIYAPGIESPYLSHKKSLGKTEFMLSVRNK
jgi:hypothetical protein